jgi:hypothetical protein
VSDVGIALFRTTSAAIRAERVLTRAHVAAKLVPIPRELAKNCGLALRFTWHHAERVRAALGEAGVEVAEVHQLG